LARAVIFFPATFCFSTTCLSTVFLSFALEFAAAFVLGAETPTLAARDGAARLTEEAFAFRGFLAFRLLNRASLEA
jgi:hypothetical protein